MGSGPPSAADLLSVFMSARGRTVTGFLILPHARSSNHATVVFAISNRSLYIELFIAATSLANKTCSYVVNGYLT